MTEHRNHTSSSMNVVISSTSYHNNNSNQPSITIVRPTEAQLRWVQFHRQNIAHHVQHRVALLWLSPPSKQDVPGALTDDDQSSSSCGSDSGGSTKSASEKATGNVNRSTSKPHDACRNRRRQRQRRQRLPISRGRRALLRVSQRAYESRRQENAIHGFRLCSSTDGTNSDIDNDVDDDGGSSSDDDFLDAIFAERRQRHNNRSGKQHRRKLRLQSRRRGPEDAERIQRFEAAFYAMMTSLSQQAQNNNLAQVPTTTKRWTRPDGVPVNVSVDGREYSDWKLFGSKTTTRRTVSNNRAAGTPLDSSFDKSASWLVHVPRKEKKQLTPAMRQHLSDVARQYLMEQQQHHDASNSSRQPIQEDDVRTLVEHFERHHVGDTDTHSNYIHNNNLDNEETKTASSSHVVVQVISPSTADLIRRYENPVQDPEGFVQRLVSQIEAAVSKTSSLDSQDELIAADGKLHKPAFARLIQKYLLSQTPNTTTSYSRLERRKQNSASSPTFPPLKSGKTTNNTPMEPHSSESKDEVGDEDNSLIDDGEHDEEEVARRHIPTFVQAFMEQFELDDDVQTILTAEGTLNRPAFEILMQRYLIAATNKCLRDGGSCDDAASVHDDNVASSLYNESAQRNGIKEETQLILPSSIDITRRKVQPLTPPRETMPSNLLGRIRSVGAKINSFRFGFPEANVEISESQTNEYGLSRDPASSMDMDEVQITGSVSNKVSELFRTVNSRINADDEAYTAFRLAQNQRRVNGDADDDLSSQSSFKLLPARIRNAVKSLRNEKLRSRRHVGAADDDSEHKREVDDAFTESSNDDDLFEDDISGAFLSQLSNQDVPDQQSYDVQSLQTALMPGVGPSDESIIYADGSIVSGDGSPGRTSATLMLTPALLTKRHHQAIRAVESRKWDHVQYLLSANPWLAEMADANTNQYVLHKVSFYGAGLLGIDHTTGEVISIRYPPSSEQINSDLIRLFPSSVHKFDRDGNLPLHMASASANFPMIQLLGERFPGGASVRNEDGMLPLHLVIIACASPVVATYGSEVEERDIVKRVIDYFPGAIGVVDNEGNLPIHTAASVLQGSDGAAIIYYLLDEAERQISGPSALRFRNTVTNEDLDCEAFETETTATSVDSVGPTNEATNCLLIRNERGYTPLMLAILSRAGWEVIEALTCHSGGLQSLDEEGNNALHVLVSDGYSDPAAALTVLRLVPEAATRRNEHGMLPIEMACMHMLPREVILAIVLVDLPIDLDQKDGTSFKEGYGASWWYLTCECDDYYLDIVDEVVSLCCFAQVRALCLYKDGSKDMVLSRAAPKSRNILLRALRVVGRFEFVESAPVYVDENNGVAAFNALDFGTPTNPYSSGRRVLLKCFTSEQSFVYETAVMSALDRNSDCFEDVLTFILRTGDFGRGPLPSDGHDRFCVVTERPELTLSGVMRGMLGNRDCQHDPEVRRRYSTKVFSVLRHIAKSLHCLHAQGFIHGALSLEKCGKFNEKWKLSGILEAQKVGNSLDSQALSSSAPPESVTRREGKASFRNDLIACTSFDSWSFGKLAYEVIVGDSLIEYDVSRAIADDHESLEYLLNWNDSNLQNARRQLEQVGLSYNSVALVLQCLSPSEEQRLTMEEVLQHDAWLDIRRS